MESKKKVPTLNKVAYGIGTGGGVSFELLYGHSTDRSRSNCYHVLGVPYF